jgi:16S rRNA (uracil1498-N3)-methyltransferase
MAEIRHFAVDPDSVQGGKAILKGEEFHHLARVVRSRVGSKVRLLDGSGTIYEATVSDIGPDEVLLDISSSDLSRHPPLIDIAISAIKAPRLDLVAEKCSEIGLRRLIVFYSARSMRKPGRAGDGAKVDRLRRKALSACKQSGQPFFPEIFVVGGIKDVTAIFAECESVYIADREGGRPAETVSDHQGGPALGIVGPEGGFTDEEREIILSAGAEPMSLGDNRLRSETAAVCLLFALRSCRPSTRAVPSDD